MSKKEDLERQKAGTKLKVDKGKYYNVEFKFDLKKTVHPGFQWVSG